MTLREIQSLDAWFSRLVTLRVSLLASDCGLSKTPNRALPNDFISLHVCLMTLV